MADVEGVIRERLAEIDSEKRRLEAALAQLTGGQDRRSRRRRTTPTGRQARTASRAKPGERRRQVLAHLEKHSGARPTEIASAIKTSPSQVHAVIAKLRKDKLVRKRGQGYGLARAARSSTAAKAPAGARASKARASSSRRQSATT